MLLNYEKEAAISLKLYLDFVKDKCPEKSIQIFISSLIDILNHISNQQMSLVLRNEVRPFLH